MREILALGSPRFISEQTRSQSAFGEWRAKRKERRRLFGSASSDPGGGRASSAITSPASNFLGLAEEREGKSKGWRKRWGRGKMSVDMAGETVKEEDEWIEDVTADADAGSARAGPSRSGSGS